MRRALVAVAALVMLAGGCRGGEPSGGPTSAPPVSPTAPESSAPTSSAPPEPETAVEFIRRFVDVQNEMLVTGETSDYRKLVSKDCTACSDLVRRVQDLYRDGGQIRTEGWTVSSVDSISGTRRARIVRIWVESAPTTYTEEPGGSEKSFDGGRLLEQFTLAAGDRSFVVLDYAEVSA